MVDAKAENQPEEKNSDHSRVLERALIKFLGQIYTGKNESFPLASSRHIHDMDNVLAFNGVVRRTGEILST